MSNMEEELYKLRLTSKQMERLAKKADKDQKVQQAKVKKAIEQKNIEGARLYAENAIRKKHEGLTYLRMAARIDAVSAKVQTAVTMKGVMKNMESVTQGLDQAVNSMDLEKVVQIMEKFEKQFEDMDVRAFTMEGAMGQVTTLGTPQDQVESLIRQVAEEHDLEITDQLFGIQEPVSEDKSASVKEGDDLTRRLAALRH